jgi:hypothetical protein
MNEIAINNGKVVVDDVSVSCNDSYEDFEVKRFTVYNGATSIGSFTIVDKGVAEDMAIWQTLNKEIYDACKQLPTEDYIVTSLADRSPEDAAKYLKNIVDTKSQSKIVEMLGIRLNK